VLLLLLPLGWLAAAHKVSRLQKTLRAPRRPHIESRSGRFFFFLIMPINSAVIGSSSGSGCYICSNATSSSNIATASSSRSPAAASSEFDTDVSPNHHC
jgi:hypothetical protein